jgi:polyisoprenoid-binding protein YceI
MPWYPNRVLLRMLLAGLALALLASPADAQSRRWVPVPGKSLVAFEATHRLGEFRGSAETVTGEFEADPADIRTGFTGTLRVPVAALRTGDTGRDRDMLKLLQADTHKLIRYTIGGSEASFNAITATADVLLTIKGALEVRGVERPLVFLARARLIGDRIWVRGESRLRLTDFGIEPPRRLLFRVGNEVGVSFDVTLKPAD